MLDRQLAYLVFRLTLGINILVHGAGRIFGPGAEAFASTTGAEFSKTGLPVGVQMIYAITYYLLLVNRSDNRFSLDDVFFAKRS